MNNQKGQMSIWMILIFVGLLLSIMVIFAGGLITTKIYDALNQDINMGQVNLQNVTNDTFGYFKTMYLNNADWWGISIIFGMIFGLFLSAYLTRGLSMKWGIILDIFIIIGVFIACLYISSAYEDILSALSGAGETFLEDYAPKTSTFMLNLPIFSVIIGVVTMILFHSSIPRKTEEQYQSGGYLQGAY